MQVSSVVIIRCPILAVFDVNYGATQKDPFLELTDDTRLKVLGHADVADYGSVSDDRAAVTSLSKINITADTSNRAIISVLLDSSADLMKVDSIILLPGLLNFCAVSLPFAAMPVVLFELLSASQTEGNAVGEQLLQTFVPDAFGFGPRLYFDAAHSHTPVGSRNSVYFEEVTLPAK